MSWARSRSSKCSFDLNDHWSKDLWRCIEPHIRPQGTISVKRCIIVELSFHMKSDRSIAVALCDAWS